MVTVKLEKTIEGFDTPSANNVQYSSNSAVVLSKIFEGGNTIPVTYYSSLSDYKYAVANSTRYDKVEEDHIIGRAVSFSADTKVLACDIYDTEQTKFVDGKIRLRVKGNRLADSSDTKVLNIRSILAFDIITL